MAGMTAAGSRWSIAAVSMLGATRANAPATRLAGDPVKGRQVYLNANPKCSLCHMIGASGGKFGPELTAIGKKRDAAWLAKYLPNPKFENPANKMPAVDCERKGPRGPDRLPRVTQREVAPTHSLRQRILDDRDPGLAVLTVLTGAAESHRPKRIFTNPHHRPEGRDSLGSGRERRTNGTRVSSRRTQTRQPQGQGLYRTESP